MEMKDEIRLDASRDAVWAALNNPDVLKACIPGCETLEMVSDTEFESLVVIKVGPIRAKFCWHGNVVGDQCSGQLPPDR